MRDIILKYPIWQEPYRAAVIESNPTLLKQKIALAEQAAVLRLKQLETLGARHQQDQVTICIRRTGTLENSTGHHHEVIALTDALSALKILAETAWAE